jgi:hypothetical protein
MLDLLHRTRKTACASLLACVVLGVFGAGAARAEALPEIASVTPAEQTGRVGKPITRIVITGTNLAHVTAEGLPAELPLKEVAGSSPTEWEITGEPAAAKPETTITLSAKNAAEEPAAKTASFTLTVLEALPIIESVSPPEQTGRAGKPITRIVIKGKNLAHVTAEGLPAELPLKEVAGSSPTEWEITGEPATAKPETTITLSAKNAAEEAALSTAALKLTVLEALPIIESVSPPEQTGTVGKPITRIVIKGKNLAHVTAEGLPAELPLKEVAGSSQTEWEITGEPAAAKPETTITLSAKNAAEEAALSTPALKLTVTAAPQPPKIETPSKPVETPSKLPETPKIASAGRLGTMPTQKKGRELWASFLCEVASCKVQVMATITAGKTKFKLHSVRTPIAQGKKMRIALKLTKKQQALIVAALNKRKKVTAALSASIDSSVGRQVTKALVVTVKR